VQADKKEHIINVAIELFAEKGFEGTSIRELAAKADVNLAMINYYFGSKEALFEEMVEQKIAFIRNRLQELVDDKSMSEIEKVDAIIESYANHFFSNPNYSKVIQQEMLVTHRTNMHEKAIDSFIKNTNNFISIIEKGIKKKVFKKVDSPLVFATIIGTLNQVLKSKKICNAFLSKDVDTDPYKDDRFKQRLIDHIKQMTHAYLLKD
jgi:AcrR family transcriptional regulator